MANFQVKDAYGSVITIQSSTFGSAERQIVGASIIGTFPVTVSGNPSISGQVGASIIGLTPVAVTNTPSVSGTLGASVIGTVPVVQSGTVITSLVSTVPSSVLVGASIIGLTPVNVVTSTSVGISSVFSIVPVFQTNNSSISGTVGATQSGTWAQSVIGIIAPTSSVMSLATQASTTTALAANTARRGAMVSNNSATSIMVKLGAMANSGDFTLLMQNTDYYEVPFNYSGRIDYFSSSVAGVIKVTEIT